MKCDFCASTRGISRKPAHGRQPRLMLCRTKTAEGDSRTVRADLAGFAWHGRLFNAKHCGSGGRGIGRHVNRPIAQTMSVQSLIDDGYTVVGVTAPAVGGAGIYLQKGKALVFCFTAETPASAHGRDQILQAGQIAARPDLHATSEQPRSPARTPACGCRSQPAPRSAHRPACRSVRDTSGCSRTAPAAASRSG